MQLYEGLSYHAIHKPQPFNLTMRKYNHNRQRYVDTINICNNSYDYRYGKGWLRILEIIDQFCVEYVYVKMIFSAVILYDKCQNSVCHKANTWNRSLFTQYESINISIHRWGRAIILQCRHTATETKWPPFRRRSFKYIFVK